MKDNIAGQSSSGLEEGKGERELDDQKDFPLYQQSPLATFSSEGIIGSYYRW